MEETFSSVTGFSVGGGPSVQLSAENQGPAGFQSGTHSELIECFSEGLGTRNGLLQALPEI